MKLKYGMNPNQGHAEFVDNEDLKVLNGNPSYINFLDALNSWPLVKELKAATSLPSATSFKHVTPSGAATAVDCETAELRSYLSKMDRVSGLKSAYLKARGSDRLASFGDFIALSDQVDTDTAKIIRSEVSDGIIAPAYCEEALEILRSKKKGNYPIFQINPNHEPASNEIRQLYGFTLKQDRNELKISPDLLRNIRSGESEIPEATVQSLLVGLITLKYTQSNSIAVTTGNHAIGIGSGQQSRILCAELALKKANRWHQKTKLDYSSLVYPCEGMTRTEKDMYHDEMREKLFQDKVTLNELNNLCLCSDGFFPQTDNIQLAHKYGIRHIAAPTGSIKDEDIFKTCQDLGITFIDIGTRLFHH